MIIRIKTEDEETEVVLTQGETLLAAINKARIEGFEAPCGGKHNCGKCRIILETVVGVPEPDSIERKYLSESELASGMRLACRILPEVDMAISLTTSGKHAVIQTEFYGAIGNEVFADKPVLRKKFLELSPPSIEDQRSDLLRVSTGFDSIRVPVDEIKRLPALLRENSYTLTALSFFGELTAFEAGNTESDSWAVAVDIGTTTVVAYLVSLFGGNRGVIADVISALNSQTGYGSDVISRIEYCTQKKGNLEELKKRIVSQLSGMFNRLAERNCVRPELINLVTIVGNTTMTHIFTGLDPSGIASAPFIPVDTGLCAAGAADFGLDMAPRSYCLVLPGISSYVGSDITAGIIASGMDEAEELSLLIDIGTNGEIVLGNRHGMVACSTAAGPALEGANISCGMGGVPGAINKIHIEETDGEEGLHFDVIGGGKPGGVCGSGIVDAVAVFLQVGLIDKTGRILSEEKLLKAGKSRNWIEHLAEIGGFPSIKIAEGIYLTQKDVREIQMAKAAIAAGVKILLGETGKLAADVKHLYIAGGFGAAMNKKSAAAVGLFPPELEDVVEIAGNTAGKGAILSALSEKIVHRMKMAAEGVRYTELSTNALFQQEYIRAMPFHSS